MLVARGLVVAPPGAEPRLAPIDLVVRRGEWASLGGPNGAGKSTLLAALAGMLAPKAGTLTIDGEPLSLDAPARARVGIVFQEPEAHFLTPRADTEIAFPLENLGWPRSAIDERVRELATRFDLAPLLARELETLSGGEQARVALAVALATKPDLLLLDEPANYLDPDRRARVREWVAREVARGAGVIWATQLEEEMAAASPRLLLEGGRLVEVSGDRPRFREPVPSPTASVGNGVVRHSALLLRARGVSHAVGAGASERVLFRDFDLELLAGELLLVEGESGSGKSTLLALLSGLTAPKGGEVLPIIAEAPGDGFSNRFGVLLQSPEDQLVGGTVFDDLRLGRRGEGGGIPRRELEWALERVGLDPGRVGHAPPGGLSHGERRRVAWAGLMLLSARLWILDEPTSGVDGAGVRALQALVEAHLAQGGAAIIAHQDPRLEAWAGRRLRLHAGRLVEANAIPK